MTKTNNPQKKKMNPRKHKSPITNKADKPKKRITTSAKRKKQSIKKNNNPQQNK